MKIINSDLFGDSEFIAIKIDDRTIRSLRKYTQKDFNVIESYLNWYLQLNRDFETIGIHPSCPERTKLIKL